MIVLVSVALLLLTLAVVLLFAMVGELASNPSSTEKANSVKPLPEFRRGTAPQEWPESLIELSDRPQATLLVLSPICSTCNQVAAELPGLLKRFPDTSLGLIVSAGSKAGGAEFIARHTLQKIPYFIDERGLWVNGSLGVNISPSALLLEAGVLSAAYTFGSLEALRAEIGVAI